MRSKEELIMQHGGRASGSVSAKTDFVVAGEKPAASWKKAQKLGVKVLSEEDFQKLIET